MPTSKDVAQRAGVSRATVSAVINGSAFVSPPLVERVRDAMRELHYRPNHIARSLRTRTTRTVGLVVSNIDSPFWGFLVEALTQELSSAGYHCVLANTSEDPQRERQALEDLVDKRADGLLLAPCGDTNRALVETLVAGDLPVVLVDRFFTGLTLDTVLADNVHGGYVATRHLLETGRRRPAVLTLSLANSTGRQRLEGYRRALYERGVPERPELVCIGDHHLTTAHGLTRALLQVPVPPDAILACSHLAALGAVRAVCEAGLRIPDDIAVVGYDDVPWSAYMWPPLSVVAQPIGDMGRTAAEVLIRRLRETPDERRRRPPREILFRPELIVRTSSATPPTNSVNDVETGLTNNA
jgi:LacI family transcriptional regulator